jgi:hypothetical protein
MELVVSGWGRNHGPRTIVEGDVEGAALRKELRVGFDFYKSTLQFFPPRGEPNPSIQFYCGADLKGLNGSYLVELRLRKSEVARLFAICFQDDSLSAVIKSLEQATEDSVGTD